MQEGISSAAYVFGSTPARNIFGSHVLFTLFKAAHTLDVQCTPCKHDVPKLDETCQCVEVSVLSTPCIAWYDGNQDRFDFRPAVPSAAVPSCKCVDQSRATC
ncbi:hypothetical protein J6590_101085 [Homalodisca vitripennis]|nr:hypothetical protein J6590_101085 [Homalodisca vitripennis]